MEMVRVSQNSLYSKKMESANPSTAVQWSDIPPELLDKIAKRLPTEIDIRRFRAVCSSWRSSTRPYKFPTIKLPFYFHSIPDMDPKHIGAYFTLTERIVYRIQSPDSKTHNFWLVKVEHADNGKVKIINPVTHRKIEIPPVIQMPEVLNILDFDVSEVCKAYALRYVNPSTPDESDDYYDYRFAKKVVFSADVENGEYTVMVIDLNKRLWHINSGCESWTPILGKDYINLNLFYDVAIVKGQVHVIDGGGCVWALNSKFGWRRAGGKRTKALKIRLVELCNGELVLVEEMGAADGICLRRFYASEMVVDVQIHALSEQGNGLVDANAMNGSIIVVGDDCSFSVPTSQELKGARVFYTDRYCFLREHDEIPDYLCYECDCRGSCSCVNGLETIIADELVANDDVRRDFKGFYGHNIGVCDFETGGTGTTLMFPEYASIFWPPPAWLSRS